MKVLDVEILNDGIEITLSNIEETQAQISAIQRSVRDLASLENELKGKTGESIRSFFETVHQPFLIFLHQSLTDYSLVLKSIQSSVETYEPDPTGIIREDFIMNDVKKGLDDALDMTEEIVEQANKAMASVSDIISLKSVDMYWFNHYVQTGKRKLTRTVDQLYVLDASLVNKFEPVQDDLSTMDGFLRDMGSRFKSGNLSITNYNINSINGIYKYDGFRLNSAVPIKGNSTKINFMDNRSTVKSGDISASDFLGQYDGVINLSGRRVIDDSNQEIDPESEEGKKLREYLQKADKGEADGEYALKNYKYPGYGPLRYEDRRMVMGGQFGLAGTPSGLGGLVNIFGDVGIGAAKGVFDVAKDTVVGAYSLIAHPFDSAVSLYGMVRHLDDTLKMIGQSVRDSFQSDVANGNTESRSRWVTNVVGEIVGFKGAGIVVNTSASMTKARRLTKNGKIEKVKAADPGAKGTGYFIEVNKITIINTATVLKKGGETVVGHALQKHAGRNPNIWGGLKVVPNK